MSILTVIAKFTVKPGREAQVKQGLEGMLAPSRQEEGNLRYDAFQSPDDPTLFFTYEDWTGKDALDKHMQTSHFQKFDAECKDTLAQPFELSHLTQIGAGS